MHSKILVIISPTKNIRLDVENVLYPYNIDLTVPEHIYKKKDEWLKEETRKYVDLGLTALKRINELESELNNLSKTENEIKQIRTNIKTYKAFHRKYSCILSDNYHRVKTILIDDGYSFDNDDNIISWNNDIDGKFYDYRIGGKYENSISKIKKGEIKRCTFCTILDFTFDEISDDDPTHIPISEEAKTLPSAIVSEAIGWHDIKGKNKEEVNKEIKKNNRRKTKVNTEDSCCGYNKLNR